MGREEHHKQTSLACVGRARSVWATLGLPPLTGVCAFPVYTAQAPGCSAGELSKAVPGLHALPRSKPLRFRFSGTQVLGYKGTDSVGPAFCALPRSKQLRPPGALQAHPPRLRCVLSSPWSQSISFLGVQQEHHLRCAVCLLWGVDLRLQSSWQMSTVQDPRKTWLATESLLTV